MNNRIRELAEQAGLDIIFHLDEMGVDGEFELWKFAEMIVQECANACYKHKDVESFGIYPVRVAMVTKACADNIREHFGVNDERTNSKPS